MKKSTTFNNATAIDEASRVAEIMLANADNCKAIVLVEKDGEMTIQGNLECKEDSIKFNKLLTATVLDMDKQFHEDTLPSQQLYTTTTLINFAPLFCIFNQTAACKVALGSMLTMNSSEEK